MRPPPPIAYRAAALLVGATFVGGLAAAADARGATEPVGVDAASIIAPSVPDFPPTVPEPQPTSEPEPQLAAPEPEPAPTPPPDARQPVSWNRPCEGPVISGYGPRSGRRHDGMDVKCPNGGPVAAPLAGIVVQAGPGQRGYGQSVTIDHGFGITTLLPHLSVVEARVGQRVARDEVIGRIGQTGNATTPHLHYEIRVHGRPVNPEPYYH